jgi:hypothetical protein
MCAGAPAASPFDEGHTSVLSFGPSAARRGRPLTVLCTLVDAVTQPRERERDREKRSTVSLVTTRLVHHGRWTGHPRPGAPAASRTTWPASRTTWRGASSGAPPSICGFSGSSAGGGGAERRRSTCRERMVPRIPMPHQEPILLLPQGCFRRGGFPNPKGPVVSTHPSSLTLPASRSRRTELIAFGMQASEPELTAQVVSVASEQSNPESKLAAQRV